MRVMAAAAAGTMPGARPAQAFRVAKARPLAGELQGRLCASEVCNNDSSNCKPAPISYSAPAKFSRRRPYCPCLQRAAAS